MSSHGDPISTAVASRSPNHRATLTEPHKAPLSLPGTVQMYLYLYISICICTFGIICFVCMLVTGRIHMIHHCHWLMGENLYSENNLWT